MHLVSAIGGYSSQGTTITMHFNNLLKKKLHNTRLTNFFRKNPCIIFYHTREGEQLRRRPPVVDSKASVLFLTNARQFGYPTAIVVPNEKKKPYVDNRFDSKERKDTSQENIQQLYDAARAGIDAAAGNTYFVGCNSLKEMRHIFLDCVAPNYICLGGICDNCYLNYADMYRLAHLKNTPRDLLSVLTGSTHSLVHAVAVPQTKFLHLLNISSPTKASPHSTLP